MLAVCERRSDIGVSIELRYLGGATAVRISRRVIRPMLQKEIHQVFPSSAAHN